LSNSFQILFRDLVRLLDDPVEQHDPAPRAKDVEDAHLIAAQLKEIVLKNVWNGDSPSGRVYSAIVQLPCACAIPASPRVDGRSYMTSWLL
jgi:hypothetical protein